jgi:hypothetical protein
MKLSDPSHLAEAERIGERAVAEAEALIRNSARRADQLLPADDELTVNAAALAIQAILLRTTHLLDTPRALDAIGTAYGASLAQVQSIETRVAMTARFGAAVRTAGLAVDRDRFAADPLRAEPAGRA